MACLIGGFGLAFNVQVNFLIALRARELGASFEVIGILVGAGSVVPALLAVPLGALIDRLGPRRAFSAGTAVSAGLALVCLTITGYWWLLPLQLLLGTSRNLGWVASQRYITGFAAPDQRAALAGRFSLFSGVGQMASPLIVGGLAEVAGVRLAFLGVAAYAAGFAVIGALLAETSSDRREARAGSGLGLRSAVGLLGVTGIQVSLLLTFARLWTAYVYSAFFPVFLIDAGLGPGIAGTVMAASGLVSAAVAPTAGFCTRRLDQATVAALGLGCTGMALVLAPHVATVPAVYVVPALIGLGQGISLPLVLSITAAASPPDRVGVALGLRSMSSQVAALSAPVAVGPAIAAFGAVLGFAFGGVVTVAVVATSQALHLLARWRGAAGAPLENPRRAAEPGGP